MSTSASTLLSTQAKYKGFVHADTNVADALPSTADVRRVHDMMSKRNRKQTRATHSLFARGFKDEITLQLTESALSALRTNAERTVVLELPSLKLFYAAAVEDMVYVFVPRSGVGCFKCHCFRLASAHEGQELTALLAQQIVSRRTRRNSVCFIARSDSMSTEQILSVSAPSLSASSSVFSSTSSLDKELEDAVDDMSLQTNSAHGSLESLSLPAIHDTRMRLNSLEAAGKIVCDESEPPCGICEQRSGDNWIALKTCSHQFHLPCITAWRRSHNVCPTCTATVSDSAFSLNYIGGYFSEGQISGAREMEQFAADYVAATTGQDLLRLQVSKTHLTLFEVDEQGFLSAQRASHPLQQLRRVLLLGTSRIAIVFADGTDGYLIQLFDCPVTAEIDRVYECLEASCEKNATENSSLHHWDWNDSDLVVSAFSELSSSSAPLLY